MEKAKLFRSPLQECEAELVAGQAGRGGRFIRPFGKRDDGHRLGRDFTYVEAV